MGELPQGWTITSLNEICSLITDGTHQTPKYTSKGIPFISTANLRPFSTGFDFSEYSRFISLQEHAQLTRRCRPEKGDILVSKCGTIGRVKEIDVEYPFSIFVGLGLLKPYKGLFYPKFAEFWLNCRSITDQFGELAPGSTRRTLTIKGIKSVEVPLPPLNEQRRIVAKLENILRKLDASKERLDKIPVILKRFRQSVLAAACSGRLTADWRKKNKNGEWTFGPLSKQPIVLQTGPFGSALHKSDYMRNGVPVINPMHIREGRIYPSEDHCVSKTKAQELSPYELESGDIILGRRGEMGRAAVVAQSGLWCGTGSMFIRVLSEQLLPAFVSLFLRSPNTVATLSESSVGSTMINLNQKIVLGLEFPIVDLDEQQEIVRRVEALFKKADEIEVRYKKAKPFVDKLTQSILAKAFRGELVPQDPNDEPASVLLERIKAERQKAHKSGEARGNRRNRYKTEPETMPMAAEKRAVYGRKARKKK